MQPSVTILIPVYNGERTLERAILSALQQTLPEIKILILDNCSNDRTRDIAESYARQHKNITYHRNAKNLGSLANFQLAVERADTTFVKWLGADDTIDPRFAELTVAAMDGQEDIVVCAVGTHFVVDGEAVVDMPLPLMDSYRRNLDTYLRDPGRNNRLHGMHRREVIREAIKVGNYPGWDLTVIAETLRCGRHTLVPEILMTRDQTSGGRYVQIHNAQAKNKVFRHLPMLPLTIDLLLVRRFPISKEIIKGLLRLNIMWTMLHIGFYYKTTRPYEHPLYRFWHRRIGWRFDPPPPAQTALRADAKPR